MNHLNTEILVPFLDGELPADEMARCREHLRECPACRRQVEQHGAVWDGLDALPVPAEPDGLTAAILSRTTRAESELGPRRLRQWARRLAVPAGLAAAIVLAVLAWPGETPKAPADPEPTMELVQETPAQVERILRERELLDTMHEYGDLIEYFDVLVELDKILSQADRAS